MKKSILFFTIFCFFILLADSTFGQRKLKYKDIYQVILTGDKETSYTLLLAFQKQDPQFANTYFQLAIIAKSWAEHYDPLTQLEMCQFFIYNTKLYLGLAKLKMLDEGGGNREYYENAGIVPQKKKISNEEIIAFLDANMAEIIEYEKNIIAISKYFNKAVNYYNNCVIIFKQINNNFDKIKDIYLSSNPVLAGNLLKLKTDFDSSTVCFNKYSDAVNKFPILNYHQKYQLKPIETYRLEGLTNTSFLQNDMILWNYTAWVNDVNRIKSSQIAANTAEIIAFNKNMTEKLRSTTDGNYTDETKPFKLDEKFIYRIEKFDNSSLLTELFRLNESLINFAITSKSNYNNPQYNKTTLLKRTLYFRELIKDKLYADSVNHVFEQKITDKNFLKYSDFYQNAYSGIAGLKAYSAQQKINLDAQMETAYGILLNFTLKELNFNLPDSVFSTDKKLISTATILKPNVSGLKPKVGYITDLVENEDKTKFTVGYFTDQNSQISAFTANLDTTDKIINAHSVKISTTSADKALKICRFSGGYYLILNSKETTGMKNYIITLDKSGNEIKRTELNFNNFPRFMQYDEINDNILCAFQGIDENDISGTDLTVVNFNVLDQNIIYRADISIKGRIFDIIKMDKNIFVFTDFTSYKLNDKEIRSQAGNSDYQTNIALFIIDNQGKVIQNIPYFSSKSCFGLKAVKLNSSTINIPGIEDDLRFENLKELSDKPLHYLIINSEGTVIFSNRHD